jgi:iron-sulfur cluster repair protein YtfE (RIC family)
MCGCRQGGASTCRETGPAVLLPEETVEAMARRSPRALEILRGFGIDTCCGGGLTLGEAAAAAGFPAERVLRALDEAETA